MEFVSNLTSYINDLATKISVAINDSTVNLKDIERRRTVISEMELLNTAITDIKSTLTKHIQVAKEIHAREFKEMNSILSRICESDQEDWTKVVRTGRRNTGRPTLLPATKIAQTVPPSAVVEPRPGVLQPDVPKPQFTEKPQYTHVKFTEALSLPAIRVNTFDQVVQNGELYYVADATHFAFRLGGKLFHGNIGTIYTEEKNPIKIKSCKFASQCIKKNSCDYYHDPTKFVGSADHRNFIASSWLYAPAESQFKNKMRSRRFGSLEHLDTDIVGLQNEETDRFYDQMMHDFLCTMLLLVYYNKD